MQRNLFAPRYRRNARLMTLPLLLATLLTAAPVTADIDPNRLRQSLRAIDADLSGELGVYVKHLETDTTVGHDADRYWYLASTVKIPLAVAVLQAVEDGVLSQDRILELKETDYVDGAGDLLWHAPGERFSIETLLSKSITNSDSTATDMLMRHLGVDEFNRRIRESMVAVGFAPLTTILQVRYDAYAELHPRARELSNMDYVEIRSAGSPPERVRAFREKLNLARADLEAKTLTEAFDRYYERRLNSATLVAFGTLLERLVEGELLNSAHTEQVLGYMRDISTGEGRLQAGLPEDTPLAQKTGTQIQRACNIGVAHPADLARAVVIATCAEDYGSLEAAENAFSDIASTLHGGGWLGSL